MKSVAESERPRSATAIAAAARDLQFTNAMMGILQMIERRSTSFTRAGLFVSVSAVLATVPAACNIPDATAPPRIAGGRFEASGVVAVPATNGVLFVDDKSSTEIFWMELAADGRQADPPVKVPLGATVGDPEAMTTDGVYFYVVGSQSTSQGTKGDGIVRFKFDASRRKVTERASIPALKAFLATHVAELNDIDPRRGNEEELNVEGLAWDPTHSRLLLGLRAPVIEGNALVIPLKLRDPHGAFQADNLELDGGKAIRLALGGAGVRSLEYDQTSRAFWMIAASEDGSDEFRILEWRNRTHRPVFTELARYSSKLKPEGITRASVGGTSTRFLVFDTGRYTNIQ